MEERSDALARPWNLMVGTTDKSIALPADATVTTVFDQIGAGRTLLILGEPGFGKTITLLQLARDLIARAEQDVDHLIPVVFNLSSWKPTIHQGKKQIQQTIVMWLAEELNSKYQVSKDLAEKWVKQQRLLLLLDGLDEVQAEDRDACVTAINTFQREVATELVICCRIKDYESLSNRLNMQMAICLQPLTLLQVCNYLNQLSVDLSGLTGLLATDTAIQELAQSPLLLNIMVLTYQEIATDDLPQMEVIEEQRRQLFDRYIERMLTHRGTPLKYQPEQIKGWLVILAQRMKQESQTIFLIERMQPHWLITGKSRRLYQIGIGLSLGLFFGLSFGLSIALSFGLAGGLVGGLSVGLFFGLSRGLNRRLSTTIKPVEKLKWSWETAIVNLLWGVFSGLVCGLIAGLSQGMSFGLIIGLSQGMSVGLISGLSCGLSGTEIETTVAPNQGIWNSAKNFILVALSFGLIGGLISGLGFTLIMEPSFGLSFGLIIGLLGWLTGIDYGGIACIQHFVLRLLLCHSNRIPWNYARFLDYAVERIFLRKVGGGYIFIHRMLLEHFAAMDVKLSKQ